MRHLIILLVLGTSLSAADADDAKSAPPPVTPAAVAPPATALPAATVATATTVASPRALPARRSCCEASGGRAGLLMRPAPTTPTPVVPPSP